MPKKITSTKNVEIKHLIKLQEKSRERKKTGWFIIEGLREIKLALLGSYTVDSVYFVSQMVSMELLQNIVGSEVEKIEVSAEVYRKIAYRNTTEGVVALAKIKNHKLSELEFSTKNPLLLVAESPEKPGNMGALLRTADAAGVDAVIIANPTTDLYNSNSIRSSVGCVFTTQIAIGSTQEVINYLKDKKIKVFSALLSDDATDYLLQDYTQASAIVVGTEATGLTPDWIQHSDKRIMISMNGKIDSMNVSVAAGILLFEAVRQRIL